MSFVSRENRPSAPTRLRRSEGRRAKLPALPRRAAGTAPPAAAAAAAAPGAPTGGGRRGVPNAAVATVPARPGGGGHLDQGRVTLGVLVTQIGCSNQN